MAKSEAAPAKKDRLTLTQLAGYDDILTDALVDHVYFWTAIRKNRSKYNLTRGINQDDITRILLHEVIVAGNLGKAEESLLRIPGLRKFYDRLASDREKRDFRKHMRKYINIWATDCPFEVSTTNRYNIVTYEAAITARRDIKKDEMIKYLCGTMVAMSPEEEADLDFGRSDFSIVTSTRKKTPSLFLGPARFANHDCDANARLVSFGSGGMEVVAVRKIFQGEEITVSYGESYFGENNCDCLCLSCERAGRNGWPAHDQSKLESGAVTPVDPEALGHYSLRSSRARASRSVLGSASATPEASPRKKRKTDNIASLAPIHTGSIARVSKEVPRKSVKTRSGLRNELSSNNTDDMFLDAGQAQSDRPYQTTSTSDSTLVKEEDDLVASVKAAFDKAKGHNKRKRTFVEISQAGSSDRIETQLPASLVAAHSVGIQTLPMIDVPETPRTPHNPILVAPNAANGLRNSVTASERTSPSTAPPHSTPATSINTSISSIPPKLNLSIIDETDSDLSELSPTATFDDETQTILHNPAPSPQVPSRSINPSKDAPSLLPSTAIPSLQPVEDAPTLTPRKDIPSLLPTIELPPTTTRTLSTRTPGDYIRTPLLLGEKYSRWVDCRTCGNTWVQANSYLTRKECPRCERHSMLYGYQWPKTMPVDEEDEERVMDHRTVHRFIRPEEEKAVRKKGRGLMKGEDEADDGKVGEDQEIEESPKKRARRETVKARGGGYDDVYEAELDTEEPVKQRPRKGKAVAEVKSGMRRGKAKVQADSKAKTKAKDKEKVAEGKGKRIGKSNSRVTAKAKEKGKPKVKMNVKVSQDKVVKKPRGRPRKVR